MQLFLLYNLIRIEHPFGKRSISRTTLNIVNHKAKYVYHKPVVFDPACLQTGITRNSYITKKTTSVKYFHKKNVINYDFQQQML